MRLIKVMKHMTRNSIFNRHLQQLGPSCIDSKLICGGGKGVHKTVNSLKYLMKIVFLKMLSVSVNICKMLVNQD